MRLPKELVAKELQKYLEVQKVVGVLSARKKLPGAAEPQTCFCIEGVFCEIASALGYPGAFSQPEPVKLRDFVLSERHGTFQAYAPDSVYIFLGVPKTVPASEVKKRGWNTSCIRMCEGCPTVILTGTP